MSPCGLFRPQQNIANIGGRPTGKWPFAGCQPTPPGPSQAPGPLACVQCGGEHAAHACPRPKDQPPTWANCKGPYPASSAECPAYKREARNKKVGLILKTGPPNTIAHPNTVDDSALAKLMAEANAVPSTTKAGEEETKKDPERDQRVRAGEINTSGLLQSLPSNG
ncbi:unnamed protein product [Arctia plantaginis]|uniref:Uncharacterized protein n=1 Tax=Arctia plantaginis TaxID=874455 RepID=A0A8S0Z6A4_ARCPL|nr:unnamed protein product [Arctia plantaginis]